MQRHHYHAIMLSFSTLSLSNVMMALYYGAVTLLQESEYGLSLFRWHDCLHAMPARTDESRIPQPRPILPYRRARETREHGMTVSHSWRARGAGVSGSRPDGTTVRSDRTVRAAGPM